MLHLGHQQIRLEPFNPHPPRLFQQPAPRRVPQYRPLHRRRDAVRKNLPRRPFRFLDNFRRIIPIQLPQFDMQPTQPVRPPRPQAPHSAKIIQRRTSRNGQGFIHLIQSTPGLSPIRKKTAPSTPRRPAGFHSDRFCQIFCPYNDPARKNRPMKKFIKRILLLIAICMVLCLGVLIYSYNLARGIPVWYQPHRLSDAQEHAEENQANQDLMTLLSYASDVTAAQRRAYHHPNEAAAGQLPPDPKPKTFTVSEDEANAFFESLTEGSPDQSTAPLLPVNAGRKLSKYLIDPRLAISGNRLIFAATVNRDGMLKGTVLSVALIPLLDDQGQLHLTIDGIYAGRLPIPQSMLGTLKDQIAQDLRDRIADVQEDADVYKDGTLNRPAAETATMQLFLNCLDDQTSPPFIYLPAELGSTQIAVPLKLTDVYTANDSLTFTLEPLTPQELDSIPSLVLPPGSAQ